MAEDDIYGSKAKYEKIISNLDDITKEPPEGGKAVYYCKNPDNLVYFSELIDNFEARDLSYIRRLKIIQMLKIITYLTDKKLKECGRADINSIVAHSHKTRQTIVAKKDFIKDLKCVWRMLFPECDHQGRVDETLTPYVVRHLSKKVDRSKEKLRNDRVTWEEFQQIIGFFAGNIQLQAYLMLAVESLGRPQELLYTKIKDYEFHDTFAKVWISEHGKEGTGFLQCIDSYPYVVEWFRSHPFKKNPDAFFFINKGNRNLYQQLKNTNINKQLKHACKHLGIDKNVTCYSLKRNGVTFRRQRGDSDLQIQHAARWTSTKQLKTYDMSTQEDAFKIELDKRGLSKGKKEEISSKVKSCVFCSHHNGFTAEFCTNCKRPLDRKKIEEMAEKYERMKNNEMIDRLDRMEKLFATMINGETGRQISNPL